MELKKFIFRPDGHYGYPEPVEGDSPYEYEDLVEICSEAPCCSYNMGDYSGGEPDEDDFENYEEYEEAHEEWEESQGSAKEEVFSEWQNYDVYYNTYTMLSDIDLGDISDIIECPDGNKVHDEFIIAASNTEGVVFIISRGEQNQMAIKGDVYELGAEGTSGSQKVIEIVAELIVKLFKSGDTNSGLVYKDTKNILPELDQELLKRLSEEEYNKLVKIARGKGLLRKMMGNQEDSEY